MMRKTKLSISIFKMGNVLKENHRVTSRVTSLGTKINMKSSFLIVLKAMIGFAEFYQSRK